MKKILIIGLGLIGGSIALGIKRAHPHYEIWGYDRPEVQTIALEQTIIDNAAHNLCSAEQADIILIALPLEATLDTLRKLAELKLKEQVLITDTGSTKQSIIQLAQELFESKKIIFVGGHPMAGSHKSGVRAADVHLFENAYYVLTEENVALRDLLKGLGAKFIIVNPKEHDQVTGQVSHFPHVLASSLVLQAEEYAVTHPLVRQLGAGGFRDMTRIAEADSTMWTGILLSNPDVIIERIKNFKEQMDALSVKIKAQDEKGLKQFFDEGKSIRQNMEIHRGAIPNFYDLFVAIPDEKGVVLRILALLQDFSITNIKINEENREDTHGQLQISFKTETDLERAYQIIQLATDFEVRA